LIYLPVVELESNISECSSRPLGIRRGCADAAAARPRSSCACNFRWSLYLHNREYQALAGFLAGAAVLVWKAGG